MNSNTQSLQGTGVFVLAESQSREFQAASERRQYVIANLESFGSGNYITVSGEDGNAALIVFPLTSITLRTNGKFTVSNIAGQGNANVCVGTLFGDEYAGVVTIAGNPKA